MGCADGTVSIVEIGNILSICDTGERSGKRAVRTDASCGMMDLRSVSAVKPKRRIILYVKSQRSSK